MAWCAVCRRLAVLFALVLLRRLRALLSVAKRETGLAKASDIFPWASDNTYEQFEAYFYRTSVIAIITYYVTYRYVFRQFAM